MDLCYNYRHQSGMKIYAVFNKKYKIKLDKNKDKDVVKFKKFKSSIN